MYLLLVMACTKTTVEAPQFNVTTTSNTFKAGDTVQFHLEGDPNLIMFYSGEKGHEYRYKNRTLLAGGSINMSFSSHVQFGSQPNNLQVWVSNDFTGNYTAEGIAAAKWTDISDRFTYATTTTFVGSGEKNIDDVIVPAKPFYIAFKFVGQASTPASQRTWRISKFSLQASYPENINNTLATQTTAGWNFVSVANPDNVWDFTGSDIIFRPKSSLIYSEDWAITGAFNPDQTNPDTGDVVKGYSDNNVSTHRYVFAQPGNYKVSFVAVNSEVYGHKELIREVDITIVP